VRIWKGRTGLLVAVVLVGIIGVAVASVAVGKAAEPRVDGAALAGVGDVLWGDTGSGRATSVSVEATPVVSSLNPDIKAVGSSGFLMTLSGSGFATTSTALWNGGALTILSRSATAMTVSVPAARVGALSLVYVTVRTGSQESTRTPNFTITQPTIRSVAPTSTAYAATLNVTVTGTFLKDGLDSPNLTLRGTGANSSTIINATRVAAPANTSMTGTFNLAAPTVAPPGVYDVILTYGATGLVIKAAAFTINNPLPTLTAISPTNVYAKSMQPLLLTVNGTGFMPGASGSAVKIGARLTTNTTFVSPTELTVPLTASDVAAAGAVPITVVNPAPGGGTSNAVSLTVTSDTTAPVTTITGADAAWHSTPVVLTVAATDAQSGVMKIEYDIDGAAPITLVETTITVPADGTAEGENVVNAWSTDWSGNVESPGPSVTVKIDTVGPRASGKDASGNVNTSISLKYKFTDNVSPKVQSVYVKITKTNGNVVKTVTISGKKALKTWYSFNWTPGSKGTYNYYVHGKDFAGNLSTTTPATITVK
jgi:hypothetical protein